MAKVKKSHKKRNIVIVVVLIVLIAVPILKANRNYSYNATAAQNFAIYDSNGFLQNQNTTMGFNYGFQTSDKNGCGWIAVYNALHFLYEEGLYLEEPKIEDVILQLDRFGTMGFGFLGTNPLAIKTILSLKGFETTLTFKKSEFDKKAKNADVSIMGYLKKDFSGGHYQTMIYNETAENYTIYNSSVQSASMKGFTNAYSDSFLFLITISAK